ncbi:Rap1a/Tai family immunity protein [Ferrovibrio sp. MS7]|uniref:Rap1a/Tai family immunity protein n=1 Tax=Ferrovibrio plantarum TaxID=3119164 RepID=UPI003135A578
MRLPKALMFAALLAAGAAQISLSMLPASSAWAQMSSALQPPPPFLGKDLLALCQAPDASPQRNGCLRYLQAAVAMYEALVGEGKEISWFCAPREAPAATLRQQFVEYGAENADDMAQDAIKAVRMALSDAFPCQE